MLSLNYWQFFLGYIIYALTPYVSEILLVILYHFNIRYYIISGDKEIYRKVLKIVEREARTFTGRNINGRDCPSGYFVGMNCVGLIDDRPYFTEENKIHILTTTQFYKLLTGGPPVKLQETLATDEQQLLPSDTATRKDSQKINVYHRTGQYKNFYYRSMSIDVSHINPIGDQIEIVDDIVRRFKSKGHVTVFIHGVSAAGKSAIGYLVAKAIGGNFCHTFNPTDPGDQFPQMLNELLVREADLPAVVALEEANEMIRSVHTKTVYRIADIPTPVCNKTTWVTMLDDMFLYKNIVLILTSNESKSAIDALDPAYLRPGRIDVVYNMPNLLPVKRNI
jgi:hypothetical protein